MSSSSRVAQIWLAALAVLATFALTASPATAYRFGSTVTQTAPEQTVFDWSTQRCQALGIPDLPARAFRDASNRVHLMLQHSVTYQLIGPSLDSVTLSCALAMGSGNSADPSIYDDKQWLASPYTRDGQTIYALLHDEFQGRQHPGQCTLAYPTCLYISITLATSTNGGMTYTHAAPPGQLVAAAPYKYVPDVPLYGYYMPSNIVKRADGFYYALFQAGAYGAQQPGTCVMRTKRLEDPKSWRAWDGSDYTVDFIDPYVSSDPPEQHVCQPVFLDQAENLASSLTYNTWLGQYLLVGLSTDYDPAQGRYVNGVYYWTSEDLIHWSPKSLLMEAAVPWDYQCGGENPILYPSVLDPNSQTRNFETSGRSMNLYFTRFNRPDCTQTLDRDLIKVPFEFTIPGASPGFARPKGATPMRTSLVIAYRPCTAPDEEHGAPLVSPSCSQPTQSSDFLTVGTQDANGFVPGAVGSIRLDAKADSAATPEDEADVKLSTTATDVRWNNDFRPYEGELLASTSLRLTDLDQRNYAQDATTALDLPFQFEVPCAKPAGSLRRVGATCSVHTSANSILPGAVAGGQKANWQVAQTKLYDGGPDGVAATPDNTLFEVEGIFVP